MSASCHPPPPPLVLIEDQLQGIVRRSVRTESERARQKPRLEDRLNDDLHCGLHDPVAHRGDRQRPPLAAAGLRDEDPAGRKRTVAAVPKPTPKIIEQHAHPGLLDVGDGGPVDAGGTAVAAHLPPRPLQDVSARDLVKERVEASVGVGLGRPVERSLQITDVIPLGGPSHNRHSPAFPCTQTHGRSSGPSLTRGYVVRRAQAVLRPPPTPSRHATHFPAQHRL